MQDIFANHNAHRNDNYKKLQNEISLFHDQDQELGDDIFKLVFGQLGQVTLTLNWRREVYVRNWRHRATSSPASIINYI